VGSSSRAILAAAEYTRDVKKIAAILGILVLALAAGAGGALIAHYYWKNTPVVTTKTPSTPHTISVKPCGASDLDATLKPAVGGGTAGSTYADLTLQNNSKSSCTVQGFPHIQLVDSSSNAVGSPAEQDTANGDGALITLAPSKTATATVRFVADNYPAGTCKTGATAAKITPPGSTGSLNASSSFTTWCPGFSVTSLTQ